MPFPLPLGLALAFGLALVLFLKKPWFRGSQPGPPAVPRPSGVATQNLQKPLKNQYFPPTTLPKPPANFPELAGSATEPSGAAQKLCGGLPAARLPRARSPADLKTGPRRFPASKTQSKINIFYPGLFQNLLQSSWISLETPESFLEPPKCSGRLSGAQAPARAETGQPQNWSPAFSCVHLQ